VIVVDAVARLVPGVMGNDESGGEESFSGTGDGASGGILGATPLLEYPQYTRPLEFRGHGVPEILRSGDHAKVARWRRAQSLRRTLERRPDLLGGRPLTPDEESLLREFPDPATGR
jgi:tRNA (guanine37-N1)-methyltransferase